MAGFQEDISRCSAFPCGKPEGHSEYVRKPCSFCHGCFLAVLAAFLRHGLSVRRFFFLIIRCFRHDAFCHRMHFLDFRFARIRRHRDFRCVRFLWFFALRRFLDIFFQSFFQQMFPAVPVGLCGCSSHAGCFRNLFPRHVLFAAFRDSFDDPKPHCRLIRFLVCVFFFCHFCSPFIPFYDDRSVSVCGWSGSDPAVFSYWILAGVPREHLLAVTILVLRVLHQKPGYAFRVPG